jgi:hypothetical protein
MDEPGPNESWWAGCSSSNAALRAVLQPRALNREFRCERRRTHNALLVRRLAASPCVLGR